MRHSAKFVLPFVLGIALHSIIALHPAQAQMLGLESDTNVTLTPADVAKIKAALAEHIHGKKLGSSASWSDPASGNSGTLSLQKVFERQGRRCEQIEYRLYPPEKGKLSDRYALISCLQADGTWKLSYALDPDPFAVGGPSSSRASRRRTPRQGELPPR